MNDPAIEVAMRRASDELLADPANLVWGGGRSHRRRPVDAFDINCGLCEDWANRVADLVDGVEVLDPIDLTGDRDEDAHIFIRYRGHYYDAECHGGVDDWRLLPLFSRNRRLDAASVL